MEYKLDEIMNWFHNGYKDEVYKTHIVQGNSLKDIFKKAYNYTRSSRYDNARRYEFQDKDIQDKYNNWVHTDVTMEMYYGGGVVD